MARQKRNAVVVQQHQQPDSDRRITALYVRVSTDAQYEEGYSIDVQEQKLKQWCGLKDIDRYQVYQDGGWSGSNLDRPAMKQMISDIINGKIERVVVYKLDRLSRSQKDTLFLLEEVFIPNGVDFHSINENFDTGTAYGKAMIGILSVFAQLERENIRERTRMGMYERVKEGFWMGGNGVPFGYDYDPAQNILVQNEHANDVRAIYDLYLKGYSTTRLAKMFPVANDHHVTSILDRVTYLGKISYKGEIFEGKHEPIIDENTWRRVQEERQRRSTKGIVTSHYLLTGLLYCGKCGAKMRYQQWGNSGVKIYCYSQQTSKMNLVKDPNCDNMRYNAEELERLIIDDLFRMTDRMVATGSIEGESGRRQSSIKILQQKYDMIMAKIKRLYNLYAESEDKILLETIRENQKELAIVSRALENEKSSETAITDIVEKTKMIKNLRNKWGTMSQQERCVAVRLCIDRITLTDEAIDIHYTI